MRNLSIIGRICFGIAITEIGLQIIYYHDFPYYLLPPNHASVPGITYLAYLFGALFALAGICIVFEQKARLASALLGVVLLSVFCFYFIPYELLATKNYMHFGEWENSAKELALAGGALVIACCYPEKNEKASVGFLTKLISYGTVVFSLTIFSFGIDHYLYAKEAADYVPSWAPYPIFCIYFTGTALLASSIAIILNIKRSLAAALLGAMILIWFVSLHIPRVVVSAAADRGGEITSAIIALACGGIAWVIAGKAYRNGNVKKLNQTAKV